MADSKDDASKRPARPAAPPFLGPVGGQRIPAKPGTPTPPRTGAPLVTPFARPATPPASAAGASAPRPVTPPAVRPPVATPVASVAPPIAPTPVTPVPTIPEEPALPPSPVPLTGGWDAPVEHSRDDEPVAAAEPAIEPAPAAEAESPPEPPRALLPHELPTPVTGMYAVPEPFTPSASEAGDAGPDASSESGSQTAAHSGSGLADASTSYLQAPTGEYSAQPASDLLAFPTVSDFEPRASHPPEPEPTGAPEETPDQTASADATASQGGDPVAATPERGSGLDWGAWESAVQQATESPAAWHEQVTESDAGPTSAAESHVDETGLWAPDSPADAGAADLAELDAGASAAPPEAPAFDASDEEPEEVESSSSTEQAPPPQEDFALVLDVPAGDAPDDDVPFRPALEESAPTSAANEPEADRGEPRPVWHPGTPAGYPSAASAVYAPEEGAEWSVAEGSEPSPEAAARARLADRITSVAQRVRAGQLTIAGLESLESDEAALAAVLAALLARGR